jgi:hypothetical protein
VPCQLSLVPGKTCGDKEHLGAQVGEAVDESSEDEEQHDQLHNQAEGLRFEWDKEEGGEREGRQARRREGILASKMTGSSKWGKESWCMLTMRIIFRVRRHLTVGGEEWLRQRRERRTERSQSRQRTDREERRKRSRRRERRGRPAQRGSEDSPSVGHERETREEKEWKGLTGDRAKRVEKNVSNEKEMISMIIQN